MAARRLARLVQSGAVQSVNWIVQATTTYSTSTPGANPITWGTAAEIAFLDRSFIATGNEITHDGILLTFVNPPDRSFDGAQVKIRPTFTNTVEPKLELWTLKGTTWTIQRRIALTGIARSGDTLILDLATDPLLAADNALPDAIWITLDTIGADTGLTWLCCHLYGDCTRDPVTPDCPPGTPPEDCDNVECSADVIDWTCVPIPVPPDAPNPAPVNLPPIDINVPMAETYEEAGGVFTHPCPGPTTIAMYFGDIPGGGSVRVDLLNNAGLVFAEGLSQTIAAPGVMNWTISQGYGPNDPDIGNGSAAGYLPPIEVIPFLTFRFTRIVADPALQITLLDILTYWWSVDLEYEIVCDTEDVDGLPDAQDPPDDAASVPATYTRVYERWLVYADTEDHATATRAAHALRLAKASPNPVYYGLRPEDAALFSDALANASGYLYSGFDPVVCSGVNTANIPLDFNQLADGHVIAMRLYVMPVAGLLLPKNRNLFANARHPLPLNPAPNVQNVDCFTINDYNLDLNQRFEIEVNSNTPPSTQIVKFAGPAIQPGAYHLQRGVTEDENFDTIFLHPWPSPQNPYAFMWDPACVSNVLGQCWQWFGPGWAYLLTIRVYEPTATPIGAAVELEPPVENPFPNSGRVLPGSPLILDGTWP